MADENRQRHFLRDAGCKRFTNDLSEGDDGLLEKINHFLVMADPTGRTKAAR